MDQTAEAGKLGEQKARGESAFHNARSSSDDREGQYHAVPAPSNSHDNPFVDLAAMHSGVACCAERDQIFL